MRKKSTLKTGLSNVQARLWRARWRLAEAEDNKDVYKIQYNAGYVAALEMVEKNILGLD